MNRVQQRLPRFMSLISIAQGETWNISVVQLDNKGYEADLSHPNPCKHRFFRKIFLQKNMHHLYYLS